MTDHQKTKVVEMRKAGCGYSEISKALMPQGRYLFSLLVCHEIVLQSERGSSHYPLEGNGHLERKKSKKNSALHGKIRRGRVIGSVYLFGIFSFMPL